ncbi:hypothetical protein [Bombella apis]|uniref:Uncharacterized protein n=1 Tax=Bombella apis TaxID=1785988 RepID=A0ABR9MNW0_9PROT|nr:hypothetical protein [Bombella apis]MBE1723194.1 hypothetical protein [Bombella apis]MBR9731001.1 hypothetical protein [Bombella apis]
MSIFHPIAVFAMIMALLCIIWESAYYFLCSKNSEEKGCMIIVRLRRVAVLSCIISLSFVFIVFLNEGNINILGIKINIYDKFKSFSSLFKEGNIGILSFIFFGSGMSTVIKILMEIDIGNNSSKNNFKVVVGIFKKNIVISFYYIYFLYQFYCSAFLIIEISLFFDKEYGKYFDIHRTIKIFDINLSEKMYFLLLYSFLFLCSNLWYFAIVYLYSDTRKCIFHKYLRTRKRIFYLYLCARKIIGDHSGCRLTLSKDRNPASAVDVLPKVPQPDGSSAQDRQK